MQENKELEKEVKKKILQKFAIPEDRATEFAQKAIYQSRAHGGNPNDPVEMDKIIDVVVRSWIELHKVEIKKD